MANIGDWESNKDSKIKITNDILLIKIIFCERTIILNADLTQRFVCEN